MNINIYMLPKCKFSIEAINFFKSQNISFNVYDVSKDPLKAEEMKKKSGQSNVPVIEMNDQIIIGFNESEIKRIIADA